MTRAEEIAKADAEIIEAARILATPPTGAYSVVACVSAGPLDRLQKALKARAALDEAPKPRLSSIAERTEACALVWSSAWETKQFPDARSIIRGAIGDDRREIADLIRAEFADALKDQNPITRYVPAAYHRILDALEGRL